MTSDTTAHFLKTIGQRVRQSRKDMPGSCGQELFGKMIDFDQPAQSALEKGRLTLKVVLEKLPIICKVTGKNLTFFLGNIFEDRGKDENLNWKAAQYDYLKKMFNSSKHYSEMTAEEIDRELGDRFSIKNPDLQAFFRALAGLPEEEQSVLVEEIRPTVEKIVNLRS